MLFKKTVLLGATLALMPLFAHADIITTNNTIKDSTVKVLNTGICAGTSPSKKYTPAGGTSTATTMEVRLLCGGISGECKALIYMDKECKTPPVATAILDLKTQTIKSIVMTSSEYNHTFSGSHVFLNCKKPGCK